MEDKNLNRLARIAVIGAIAKHALKHTHKASEAAIVAEKKRVEDSKRRRAVAVIDGKVIGECYINDLPGKGPTEVSVVPLPQRLSTTIEGQIKKTTSQMDDLKA